MGLHTKDGHHISSVANLLGIWFALIVLTVVTVYTATRVDLGPFNLPLAMLIATTKGSLVVLYFMHLRYDRPFHSFTLVAGLAFVALMIGVIMLDVHEYEADVFPVPLPGASE